MEWQTLSNKGESLLSDEKYTEAIGLFTEALQKGGDPAMIIPRRAWAYLKSGDAEKAAEEFSTAIELDPENPHLYSERGVARLNQRQFPLALLDLNHALELDPKNPYRYASRGYVRDVLGDMNGASEDYQKALELDPEDAIVQNNLEILQDKMKYNRPRTIHPLEAGEAIPVNPEETEEAPENVGFKEYMKEISKVFSTREGFREFMSFLKGARK